MVTQPEDCFGKAAVIIGDATYTTINKQVVIKTIATIEVDTAHIAVTDMTVLTLIEFFIETLIVAD